jgi:Acetyltransferase (GNAT) domain
MDQNNQLSSAKFSSIFRSESWISAWKQVWFEFLDAKKIQYNQRWYVIQRPLFWGVSVATAVPCGCGVRGLPSIRSEYFHFPTDVDLDSWFSCKQKARWQQFIIPDVDINSSAYIELQAYAKDNGLFFLTRDLSSAYGIDSRKNSFAEYLSSLGQSSRARLFNKRKRLMEMGSLKIENIWPDVDKFISLLNQFHQSRWGKPCYQDNNLVFIKSFLEKLVAEDGQVNLSLMTSNDVPISVLLDVTYQGRTYNFQAGYVENFVKNLALGSLHLGYEIESAFANSGITYYDFMAGQGKNTDYKSAFATDSQRLTDVYLVRPRWLYWLYKLNDRLKNNT